MKVLVLGAHPDDEAGCAATLALLRRTKNAEIHMVAFSWCSDEVPKGWSIDTLEQEFRESAGVLKADQSTIYDYPNKALESVRQKILDHLYVLRKENEYDIVFCPSSFNSNQDHITVYNEAKRAFRTTTILGYTSPSSDYGFAANPVFYVVTLEDIEVKIRMLKAYRSQQALGRPYMDAEYARGMLQSNGVEAWVPFAERFELIRMVVR
jgi:LmbE family N-acetylglucosaminyl deacetylase